MEGEGGEVEGGEVEGEGGEVEGGGWKGGEVERWREDRERISGEPEERKMEVGMK